MAAIHMSGPPAPGTEGGFKVGGTLRVPSADVAPRGMHQSRAGSIFGGRHTECACDLKTSEQHGRDARASSKTDAFSRRAVSGLCRALCALVCLAAASAAPGQEKTELEIALFRGGFGIDLFEKWAREYEAEHPDVTIRLYGHPRIYEQLLPRFAAGNPPDLCWPGLGINHWELAASGQLAAWDKYLLQPGYRPGETWADAFVPELLRKGANRTGTFVMPHSAGGFGWWYNKKLFARHGWSPPRTWEELLPLCEKIKAAGVSPITFTGRYLAYLLRGIYFPFVISAGGMEAMDRIQGLEPGAWNDPACLLAAERMMHLKRSGCFQPGCIGMSHTESQMEFLVEDAAMIPNGTWLHSEMAKLLPSGFEMEYFNCPVFADGKGDPTAMLIWVDGKWLLPAKGKHQDLAADYFRFICAPERRKEYMEKKGTITALKAEGDIAPPAHMAEVLRLFREARQTWTYDIMDWYPSLSTDIETSVRDLYNEVITPAEFVAKNEAASRKVRDNPKIRKFSVR